MDLLAAANLPARIDSRRPFDHGVWVPLSLMYPQADIPVVQVSLPTRMGPALQTQVGQALASLREEHGVLVIGSGSITHNLRELDWHAGPESVEPWALAFRDWMVEKLAANDEAACTIIAARRRMPCVTTPVMSICCRCILPAVREVTSALPIRDSPWGRWGWMAGACSCLPLIYRFG
jgi:aromatic ring-opening dioxygenase catalytic subunit (LigB family)